MPANRGIAMSAVLLSSFVHSRLKNGKSLRNLALDEWQACRLICRCREIRRSNPIGELGVIAEESFVLTLLPLSKTNAIGSLDAVFSKGPKKTVLW
jgi:hypothetical protein